MKRLLAALAIALLTGCATTSYVQDTNIVRAYETKDGNTLILTDLPCTTMAGVFAQMPLDLRKPNLKAAKIVWQGKALDACWIKDGGFTIVVDETGDAGAVEGSVFDPPKGTGV